MVRKLFHAAQIWCKEDAETVESIRFSLFFLQIWTFLRQVLTQAFCKILPNKRSDRQLCKRKTFHVNSLKIWSQYWEIFNGKEFLAFLFNLHFVSLSIHLDGTIVPGHGMDVNVKHNFTFPVFKKILQFIIHIFSISEFTKIFQQKIAKYFCFLFYIFDLLYIYIYIFFLGTNLIGAKTRSDVMTVKFKNRCNIFLLISTIVSMPLPVRNIAMSFTQIK